MTAHSQLAEPPAPQRRRDPVRRVLARMRERRRREIEEQRQRRAPLPKPQRTSLKRRMDKRKAALAISAGVMGLSTAAMGASPAEAPALIQVDTPLVRLPASELRASTALKEALVQEEGVRDTVYRDVAGFATVGCGHLVTPEDGLSVGDRISYDQILDFLEDDLAEAEAAVTKAMVDLPLFQHEYDALVDLVYNVGPGALSVKKSPRLMEAIAAHDYERMARELDYRYAGGQLARGLAYRSERRTRIFMNATYDNPRVAPAAVLASL